MDFINKEQVIFLEISQDCGQIARSLNRWATGDLEVDPHLISKYARQRCFAQAGWPVEQSMIEWLVAPACRRNGNAELLHHFLLPDELGEHTRAQALFGLGFFGLNMRIKQAFFIVHGHCS